MKRDFTYIDDIVEGISRVIERPPSAGNSNNAAPITNETKRSTSNAQAPYKLYNIGNNQPVTLRRFITALETATGNKAKERLLPMQPGDVPITYADIDDLVENIGFKPDVSIEAGILSFVEWYKRYILN